MSGAGDDHYAVLGIDRSAPAAAVKQAYFRLVRVHSPEDDPGGFQRISEAYRVLSDPAERKRYDAAERMPPDAAETLESALALVETDAPRAVEMALSLVPRHGRSPVVCLNVAALCMRAGNPAAALPIASRFAKELPGNAEVAEMLGDASLACKRIDEAERAYRAALAADGTRLGSYLGLANVHDARDQTAEALQALDRGIAASDSTSLASLPLRVRKL